MLEMVISIIIIYLFYYFWIIMNYDKNGKAKSKSKKKKNMPIEIQYFITRYNVDFEKVNYRNFLKLMGAVVAFDLSIIGSIIIYINSLWLQLLVGFVLVLIVVLVSFSLLGNYLKKKGLTKDENNKRNRK